MPGEGLLCFVISSGPTSFSCASALNDDGADVFGTCASVGVSVEAGEAMTAVFDCDCSGVLNLSISD